MLVHRARDIHKCLKNIASFTNHQAKVKDWDSDHLEWICIQIIPKEGPYCGGIYEFKIIFGKHYPKQPPQVDCITPIYHPNIDMTGEDYNVCLSLFDEWQSSFGLEDVIQGILFLMYNPNLDDPLSPWFDPSMSEKEFEENLQKTLRGQFIEDAINYEFPKMIEGENTSTEQDITSKETESEVLSIEKAGLDCDTQNIVSVPDDKSNMPMNESGKTNIESAVDNKCTPNCCNDTEKTESIISESNTHDNPIEDSAEVTEITTSNGAIKESAEAMDEETTVDKSVLTNDKTVDHDKMVDIIEEKFLTGFGELMAIQLSDDDDTTETEDACTTDSDDSYESYVTDTYDIENSHNRCIMPHNHRQSFFSIVRRNVESIMTLLVNCYLGFEAIVPANHDTVRLRSDSISSMLSSNDDCDSENSVQKSIELHLCDTEDSEYCGSEESYSCKSDSDTYFEESLSEMEEEDFSLPALFAENEVEEKEMAEKSENSHWMESVQSKQLILHLFGLIGIYAIYKLSNVYIKR